VPFFISYISFKIAPTKLKELAMISKLLNRFIILIFTLSAIMGQDTGSNEAEDDGGREMFTMVDISYSQEKGNVDFLSLYYGFSFSIVGNVGPFKDTEFSLDYSRSDDRLDGDAFSDDQYITSKFDLWANKRISPFLFFQDSYDNTIGLTERINYGVGSKVSLIKGFSISYAFLAEREHYLYYDYTDSAGTGEYYYTDSLMIDTNYYYYDTYWGDDFYIYTDSSEYVEYTDSTKSKPESFYRHSIRPKFKVKLFDDNVVFDYRFYYKPRVDDFEDYLLEHELKISIATFYELLTVDFNYSNKYNSRYDLEKIINPDTYEFYKAVDESISIGFSFMF